MTASTDDLLAEIRKLQRGQDRLEMQQTNTQTQVTHLVTQHADFQKTLQALSQFQSTFAGFGKGLAFVATIVVPIATFLLFWKGSGR